jgi:rhodanese-related sulfurtransferase
MRQLALIVTILALFTGCQQAGITTFKSDADVPRIGLADAKKDFDAGTAVIVDSRDPNSYRQEHIAGSINIPIGSPDTEFSKIPQGKKIIVYCSWPNEHTSASLAFQLNQKGIPNTFALLGGTQAWKTAGYPMEKSE